MEGSPRGLPARYAHVQLIARGGMADVYRATDTTLRRTVAVKVLAERYASSGDVRTRFRREALTAASLSHHPNVVTIFDVGECDEGPYIVMEHLQGSLAGRLGRGVLVPHAQALAWLGQAARALDAAHAAGIVHRDVKPSNLLVGDDGEVRVSDFGIARAAEDDTLTSTGTILGTSGYMSPEQARGAGATSASDRYALGCVAYELLTGERPFQGESAAVELTLHAGAPPPRASAAEPSLPRAVDEVLLDALAKDPAARPRTAAALVARLSNALAGEGWPGATAATMPIEPPRRRPRRGRVPVAAGALVAHAGAGVAVGLLVATGGDRPAATVVLTETRVQRVTATTPAETVTRTVTVERPAQAPPGPNGGGGDSLAAAAAENDRAYARIREGDFRGALPLLESAYRSLAGSGTTAEAYTAYNLALTRLALGSCDGAVTLLERSQAIQGERKEIGKLQRRAEHACRG
jgi:serine/threonine-protein kinase